MQVYDERVRPRIATPLDHYVAVFTLWMEGMWLAWLAFAVLVLLIIALIVISKARTKAHARVPHYRRTDTGPIDVTRRRETTVSAHSRPRRS